jgi:phage shock protein PspC (stress-responsive transcriptional regulator)
MVDAPGGGAPWNPVRRHLPPDGSAGRPSSLPSSTTEAPVAPTRTDQTGITDDTSDPTPPPAPARRLTRRPDGMLGGVAGGIADHLDVDPAIVRVGFVVLTFAGGLGLLLYGAGWLLLPPGDPADTTPPPRTSGGPGFWIGVALLGVAALVLADRVRFLDTGLAAPLLFVALGIALWTAGRDRRPPPGHAMSPTGDLPPATGGPAAAAGDPATPPPAVDRRLDWTPPPVPPRQRSVLGRLTIALAFIATGGGYLLAQVGALPDHTLRDGLATALLVVGAGLVVGTWVGRARWLALVGVVLLPFVVAASLAQSIGLSFAGGMGDRTVVVADAAALAPAYELGAGELLLDLRGLDVPADGAATRVRVGAGDLRVLVPPDARVVVDARVEVGRLGIGRQGGEGVGLTRNVTLEPTADDPRAGELRLDLRVAAGQLRVGPGPQAPLSGDDA